METKRFQVYKINSKLMKPYLAFCIVMTVCGAIGLITETGFNYRILNLQTSVFVVMAMQGAFGVYIVRNNMENIKYFVSWDDKELSYHLPNNSEPVNISFPDIRKIEREPQKIRIELKNNEVKYFSFNYFYFPTRTTILDFFKGLKTRQENEK